MSKIYFVIVLLMCFLWHSGTPYSVSPALGPCIEFKTVNHDFGTVVQGDVACYNFEYQNVGDAPLVISHVSSSCGCTATQWSKKPLMPGRKGKVKVSYDTGNLGVFRKTIVVYSNATTSYSNSILRIKGNVIRKKE